MTTLFLALAHLASLWMPLVHVCTTPQEHSAAPHEEEYRYYIEYERKGGEPARVTCLFERAITDNPLNTVMWTEYLSYLVRQVVMDKVVLFPEFSI